MQTKYYLATLEKGNMFIPDYFLNNKSYSDLLASIGQPISDFDFTSHLFAGLPTDYDSLVIALNTRFEQFSPYGRYGHLLTYELRLEQLAAVPDIGIPTANLATKTSTSAPPNRQQQFSQGGRRSSFHNGQGRGRNNSNQGCGNGNGSSHSYSNNSHSRPFYQKCLKVGHLAPACWHRFEQNCQAPMTAQIGSQAFVTSTSSNIDLVWYPNTGANNHLTADLSHLNLNVEQYT